MGPTSVKDSLPIAQNLLRPNALIYALIALILTACATAPDAPSYRPSDEALVQPVAERTPLPTVHVATDIVATLTGSPTHQVDTTPTPEASHLVAGYSVEDRTIDVYKFGTGKRKLMVVAGIHGGYEWNTSELAFAIIEHLDAHPAYIPPEITLYVLPVLNPDGFARARGIHGRANANGVDLNRNWPSHWQAELDDTGCWSYLPLSAGAFPGSEPETQALMDFMQAANIQAIVSYHSAAGTIFAGGQPPDAQSVNLAMTLAASSGYAFPPLETGCQYTGQLIDWASEQGIPAVDVELSNHSDLELSPNLRLLAAFLQWEP
jgi:predicted deacylase